MMDQGMDGEKVLTDLTNSNKDTIAVCACNTLGVMVCTSVELLVPMSTTAKGK